MQGWTLELRLVVALIYSLMFGAIFAINMAFREHRRDMTKAERAAEDEELKNERNF